MTTRTHRSLLLALRDQVNELEKEAERYTAEWAIGIEERSFHEGHQDAYGIVVGMINLALAMSDAGVA